MFDVVRCCLASRTFDYRVLHARADYDRDYWTVVGPETRAEFESLGAWKLELLGRAGLTPASRVLDVGCGTGLLTRTLASFLDTGSYLGTDIAEEPLAFCRTRFEAPNFSFRRGGLMTLGLRPHERFDIICFFSVFTHTFPRETVRLLNEATRALAPGGSIVADFFCATGVRSWRGTRHTVEIHRGRLLARVPELSVTSLVTHVARDDLTREFLCFRRD